MHTYKEALEIGNKLLRKNRKETSAAKLLMLHFSDLEPTELYLNFENDMPETNYDKYIKGIEKHVYDNIPIQHIMGYVYFYGYKFIVNSEVLIPRFETEELVANVLMLYDEYFENIDIDLADIGTGSGCLAIALKKEEQFHFNITATDISNSALEVAKQNAKNIGVEIEFLEGDMLEPVNDRKFDILVSNPPYIPSNEEVDDIIYDNEPHVALFGGEDGLHFYRNILSNAKKILKQKSIIAFEHGYDKGEKLRAIAKEHFPKAKIYTLKDMQKLERMTFIIDGF